MYNRSLRISVRPALAICLLLVAGCVELGVAGVVTYWGRSSQESPDAGAGADASVSTPTPTRDDPHAIFPHCSATVNGICNYCQMPCPGHPSPDLAKKAVVHRGRGPRKTQGASEPRRTDEPKDPPHQGKSPGQSPVHQSSDRASGVAFAALPPESSSASSKGHRS